MRAELKREMHERAVQIAFPDWEVKPEDKIEFTTTWFQGLGCGNGTCSGAEDDFYVKVSVSRLAPLPPNVAYRYPVRYDTRYAHLHDKQAVLFIQKLLDTGPRYL